MGKERWVIRKEYKQLALGFLIATILLWGYVFAAYADAWKNDELPKVFKVTKSFPSHAEGIFHAEDTLMGFSGRPDATYNIFEVDEATGKERKLLDLEIKPYRMTYGDGSFWAVNTEISITPASIGITPTNQIVKISSHGEVLENFTVPVKNIDTIAWHGKYIWIYDKSFLNNNLHKFNVKEKRITDTINLPEGVRFTGFNDDFLVLFTDNREFGKAPDSFHRYDFMNPDTRRITNTFFIPRMKIFWVHTISGKGDRLWCSDTSSINQIDLSERDHWQEFKLFRVINLNPTINALCDLWYALLVGMTMAFVIDVLIHMDDLMP